jgi:chloramphenicol-sensitive protein RarD
MMSKLDYETPAQVVPADPRAARVGLGYGLAAYIWWGLAPAYYKLLGDVTPIQILAHRVFWSVLVLIPMLFYRRLWREVGVALQNRRTLLTLLASTVMISTNWFTFIYAVGENKVVESSLGYYMNPLVVVVLGVVFLKERLRTWQVVSLSLAAVAVGILTVAQGRLPAISLTLAVSFGLYGYLRKMVNAGPMVGLFVETLILLPVAAALIGSDIFHRGFSRPGMTYLWLGCTGVITAIPLVWFANAAKRLRLATMGLLQYLAPTISFLLAVVFFREPFTLIERVAFPIIWVALLIYSVDSYRAFRAANKPAEEPVLSDL